MCIKIAAVQTHAAEVDRMAVESRGVAVTQYICALPRSVALKLLYVILNVISIAL